MADACEHCGSSIHFDGKLCRLCRTHLELWGALPTMKDGKPDYSDVPEKPEPRRHTMPKGWGARAAQMSREDFGFRHACARNVLGSG